MFINPIQQIGSLEELNQIAKINDNKTAGVSAEAPFKSFLSDAVGNVNETAKILDSESLKLATGESEDLHDITIASTKYSMAVDLFVQIRNKALDGYKELMNMNI